MSDVIDNQFASLVHLLRSHERPDAPVRCVIFGGTGAVGGAVVLELCRLVLLTERFRKTPLRAEIYATGMSDKEIVYFTHRLYLAVEPIAKIEKQTARRHYRIGGRIDLRFAHFHLAVPTASLQESLDARSERPSPAEFEALLEEFFAARPSPFLEFVSKLEGEGPVDGVVVGIPLPSVATYTLGFLDELCGSYGLDHAAANRVKDGYLSSFVRGLKTVNEQLARHVIIAHTTAVGGMYRVDRDASQIRLGFAHSALGKLLEDKKYFADKLTRLYLEQGFLVLITAAAIGIDMVEFRVRLPIVRGVKNALSACLEQCDADNPPFPASDLDGKWGSSIHLYPGVPVALDDPEPQALRFGAGKELMADVAIRSGENGLFSVANCTALYNVMKVAIPEELATVIVRQVLFGHEPHRSWFRGGVNYYTESDNSTFALRVLVSDERLIRGHLGAFAVQAYQALGSSTHQARLHELGLCVLMLRLLTLAEKFRSYGEEELRAAVPDLDGFFWKETSRPTFEDFLAIGPTRLARLFGRLCEVRTMVDAGLLLGYDWRSTADREPGRGKFLARLATRIRRLLSTITSLGTPIIYTNMDGEDRMLVGPYIAPLNRAMWSAEQIDASWKRGAKEHGIPFDVARNWSICNNGFLDLRAHALGSAAREPGPELAAGRVFAGTEREELAAWLDGLEYDAYFTTCGLVALHHRLDCLWTSIKRRRVELGTHETWKNFFYQKTDGSFVLSPGMVETVRMYSEGLGKVTGTEQLWPGWGYGG